MVYRVAATFKGKRGTYESGVYSAYKSKAAAKKCFEKRVSSGVYDRVTIALVNAVYLPEDEIFIQVWEKNEF